MKKRDRYKIQSIFIGYSFIILVVTIIFSITYYNINFNFLHKVVTDTLKTDLEMYEVHFSNRYTNALNSIFEIDNAIREYNIDSNAYPTNIYQYREFIDFLNEIKIKHNDIENIKIYFMDYNLMIDLDNGITEIEDKEFYLEYNEGDWNQLDENTQFYFTSLTHIKDRNNIYISIDYQNIIPKKGEDNIVYRIFNKNNQMILDGGVESFFIDVNYNELMDIKDNNQIFKYRDNKYWIDSVTNKMFGFSIVSFYNYKIIENQIKEQLSEIYMIILVVLLIGGFCSYIIYKIQIRPINYLVEKYELKKDYKRRWALGFMINKIIIHLEEENTQYKDREDIMQEILRDRFINDLIYGRIKNNELIEDKLRELKIGQEYSFFLIVISEVIYTSSTHEVNGTQKLIIDRLIEEVLQINYNVLGSTILGNSKKGYILNTNFNYLDDYEKDKFNNLIDNLIKEISEHINMADSINIAYMVGECVEDLSKIGEVMENIEKQSKYILLNNSYPVFYCQSSEEGKNRNMLKLIFRNITKNIKNNEVKELEESIETLWEQKYEITDVMALVIEILYTFKKEIDSLEMKQEEIIRIFLVKKLTMNVIIELKNICQQIMVQYHIEHNVKRNKYVEQAEEYIRLNYMNDISLLEVSQYIGINSGYLGQLFKKIKGQTLLEHITELRIKDAKRLLIETNLGINEISNKLGYSDVRSFIRYFKKYEEVTPGKYRKDNLI